MKRSRKIKFGRVVFKNDDMAACAFFVFFKVDVNGFSPRFQNFDLDNLSTQNIKNRVRREQPEFENCIQIGLSSEEL